MNAQPLVGLVCASVALLVVVLGGLRTLRELRIVLLGAES